VFIVGIGIGASLLGSAPAAAEVSEGSDSDPANQLWDCPVRHVPFGDVGVDVLRCLTFTFDPPDDIQSAVLYLDIDAPTNSLQDTDSMVVAVGQPFEECTWAQGTMPGCVIVHGGFVGGERSLVVDLLDLSCDASAPVVDATRQQALADQLATGVIHVMLQDDTAVNRAWLDVNGDPPPQVCGTSPEAVPVRIVEGQTASASDGGSSTGKTVAVVAGVAAAGAIAVAGASSAARQARVKRVRRRVGIRRVPDSGRIEIEHDRREPSVAIGVRSVRDDIGSQVLSEAGPSSEVT
jgi:hypothetical protein